MNNARRKKVAEIAAQMEAAQSLLRHICDLLEEVKDEEEEALNNMPESLQDSEKGCQMMEFVYAADDVWDDLYNLDIETMRDRLLEFV